MEIELCKQDLLNIIRTIVGVHNRFNETAQYSLNLIKLKHTLKQTLLKLY